MPKPKSSQQSKLPKSKLVKDINPAQSPEVPKDLTDRVDNAKQVINCHDLLNQGSFPGHWSTRVASALTYLGALHKIMVEQLIEHPQAHLIPELVQIKEKVNAASQPSQEPMHAVQ